MNQSLSQNSKIRLILLIILIGIMSGTHWLILVLKIPILSALPYWTFPFRDTPLNPVWILLGGLAMLTAGTIRYSRLNIGVKICVIFLAGIALQFTFAFSKNQGLDGLRERMLNSGHAEFAVEASKQTNLLETASHYEELIQNDTYQYIPSKPPGTLLFYMLNDSIAALINPSFNNRLENLITFASITWPVTTYIVIFLIFLLSKEFFGNETALDASLFYISIPSINLITLHTDQTIYPLLAVVPFLLATVAFRKKNLWMSFLSGVAYYVAVFFSFGLIVIGVFYIVPFLLTFSKELTKRLRVSLLLLMTAVAGVLASDALARLVIHYDIYLRYTRAMEHHLSWKGWENTLQTFMNANTTNIIEYITWIGMPISLMLFFAAYRSLKKVFIDRKPDSRSIFNSILTGVFFLLLLIGKTKAETARLWMFLLPVVCITSAGHLDYMNNTPRVRQAMVFLVLLLEFGTTYFILRYQDFF
jgi:hypothetical protein